MKTLRALSIACALVLSACGGGGGSTAGSAANLPPEQPAFQLTPTNFVFAQPKQASARTSKYVTANIASVTIALNTVNGSAPPAGLTTSVTTNISLSACPCNVPGPAVPPGSDSFTLTTYDATGGTGRVVSKASATYTITAGQTNSNTITLNGVPASLSVSGVPSGTAGTAFGSAQSFSVAARDADGNTILGTYANPVSLADSDSSGATTIATSGSDSPAAGQLLSSSDSVSLNYTGLAITPATITASASGATNGTGTFTPTLQAIVYNGATVSGNPEIDLYAASGTGSTGSFSASEVGWTNAPYNKSIGASAASGCSSIATVSPASGTSFTATVASSPSAGTCTLTLSDGAGQTKAVTLTYTSSSFGVQ